MSKHNTLEDIINNKEFMLEQHRYENARAAVTNGYVWASKVYQAGTSVDAFVELARSISKFYLHDLNETMKMVETTNEEHNGIIKPPTLLRPS